jgi:hypothetical protein
MLQRIQSIWLLLAAVCSFLTLQFEFYAGTDLLGQAAKISSRTNLPFTILACGIGFAALICIFLYKQRKLQIRISLLGLLASIGLIALLFGQIKLFATGTISLWAVFYFLIPVFFVLAWRGIAKDEKLVKSMDKLR